MPVSTTRPETSGTERSGRFFARALRFVRSVAMWDSERFCRALDRWLLWSEDPKEGNHEPA